MALSDHGLPVEGSGLGGSGLTESPQSSRETAGDALYSLAGAVLGSMMYASERRVSLKV